MSSEVTKAAAPASAEIMSSRGLGTVIASVIAMLTFIGAFYVLREHWGHLADGWPYLLLLLCPLLHVVMHGRGGHRH